MSLLSHTPSIPFLSFRKVSFVLSTILVLLSIVYLATQSLNFGIDFRGGILIEVRTTEAGQISSFRDKLTQLDLGEVSLQEFGQPTDILIRIQKQEGGEKERAAAIQKVKDVLGADVEEYRRVEFVGPQVGDELKTNGIYAVIGALFVIMLYIWVRFEWQFGLGAIVALIHDILLTLGLYSILQLDFNLSTLAAILTIAGYSINDTVVVFDRIRENLRKYKKKEIPDVLNISINETLARTILTSVTTLLALFALYFFGGEIIKNFSFAMIWGVLVGTYSSIFIASPLLLFFKLRHMDDDEEEVIEHA